MGGLTDDEARALGRRLVALPGWRWLPGMRLMDSMSDRWGDYDDRVSGTRGSPMVWKEDRVEQGHPAGEEGVPPDAIPDPRDPATLGCLLALVEEAAGAEVWLEPCDIDLGRGGRGVRAWVFLEPPGPGEAWREVGTGPTRAHALVDALERAGGQS